MIMSKLREENKHLVGKIQNAKSKVKKTNLTKKELEQLVAKLKDDHRREIDVLKIEHGRAFQKQESEFYSFKKEVIQEFHDLKKTYQESLDKLELESSSSVKAIEKEYDNLKDYYEKKIAEIRKENRKENAEIHHLTEKIISDLKTEKANLSKILNNDREEYENRILRLKNSIIHYSKKTELLEQRFLNEVYKELKYD